MGKKVVACETWPPAGLSKSLTRDLGEFTRTPSGLVRFYRGKTRFVCGKGALLEDVLARWSEVKNKIDDEEQSVRAGTQGHISFREAASRFYGYIDVRVNTGNPEPMAEVTAEDYKRTLNDAWLANSIVSLGAGVAVRENL